MDRFDPGTARFFAIRPLRYPKRHSFALLTSSGWTLWNGIHTLLHKTNWWLSWKRVNLCVGQDSSVHFCRLPPYWQTFKQGSKHKSGKGRKQTVGERQPPTLPFFSWNFIRIYPSPIALWITLSSSKSKSFIYPRDFTFHLRTTCQWGQK